MHKQIYVNLPVADLPRSRAFFESLGLHFEPKFSNDQGACLGIPEGSIHAMWLTPHFVRTVTPTPIADATRSTEVLVCLSCESRGEVDALVKKALAAGGTAPRAPQDHGFMYAHGFEDLDGHIWELVAMDPDAAPPN